MSSKKPVVEATNFFLPSKVLRQANILVKGSPNKQDLEDTVEVILEFVTTTQVIDEDIYEFIKATFFSYEGDMISMLALSKVCEHIDSFFNDETPLVEFILSRDNNNNDEDGGEEEFEEDEDDNDEEEPVEDNNDDEDDDMDNGLDDLLDGIENEDEENIDVLEQNKSDEEDNDAEMLLKGKKSSKPVETSNEELRQRMKTNKISTPDRVSVAKTINVKGSVETKVTEKEDILDLSHLSQKPGVDIEHPAKRLEPIRKR